MIQYGENVSSESINQVKVNSLTGKRLPRVTLPSSSGEWIDVADVPGTCVVFFYPMTGRPDWPYPEELDAVPLASGCTDQVCSYRDAQNAFKQKRVRVFGISSQNAEYHLEAAKRLQLNFPLLSDTELSIAKALELPTYDTSIGQVYQRLSLVVRDGVVIHATYPIAEPGTDADVQLGKTRASP
jgi:peroxiredoxin